MAYNLEYLVQLLDQILYHPNLDSNQKSLVESLFSTTCFVKEVFENSPPLTSDKVRKLESRITDAVYHAEDIFESYLLSQEGMLIKKKVKKLNRFVTCFAKQLPSCQEMVSKSDLKRVRKEFDNIKEETKKIFMDMANHTKGIASSSTHVDHNPKNIVVGLSEDVHRLIDRLTFPRSKLDIIPIVGMGGIGKTTLARTLYNDDKFIACCFDRRAWVTVSQNYEIREILLALLRCIIDKEKMNEMIGEQDNQKLSLELYQTLIGRRYMIVLDDVWSCEAWDDLKRFFPENQNDSRIILTTRLEKVADYASSHGTHNHINLLNADDSWNLLLHKVFLGESCPEDLEGIGKRIAADCKGLPLAIHVIGGILSQLNKNPQSWGQVAKDVRGAVATNKDEQISNILSLSYNHLPVHLKPCFLYFSVFPEDYEIQASMVIKIWVAEGFLKPFLDKTLEETAQSYLKDLVGRTLVLVSQEDVEGNAKSYALHDLVKDLCIKKAEEEKFLYVKRHFTDRTNKRRVSVHSSASLEQTSTSTNLTRSLICFGDISGEIFELQLLRVFHLTKFQLGGMEWSEIGKLMNLRYLYLSRIGVFPPSLLALRNLLTLILHSLYLSTEEVKVDMSRLRHLKFIGRRPICDFPVVLEDLQTLSTVTVDKSFPKLLEAVPNLKLGICKEFSYRWPMATDLSRLKKLETLKCSHVHHSSLSCLIFPPSLKKLVIQIEEIPGEFLNKIGRALPNMEVLKLHNSLLWELEWVWQWEWELEWEPAEGDFCRLRVLLLDRLILKKWTVDETHYPRLERLIIRKCAMEIPRGIGDIPTLELIEVQDKNLSSSTVLSASEIQNEQLEQGNDALKVRIVRP